jgi:L-histidine Nalpha-methyltransferase
VIESVEDNVDFWADGDALVSALQESPPRIPPHFGYDALGSDLFEEITELPDYYLTRVEDDLLRRHADDIAAQLDTPWVAELGSGSAKKTRALLSACAARNGVTYLPVDVSREMLVSSEEALAADGSPVDVLGLWGRYEAGLRWIHRERPGPVTIMWLGSSVGNSTRDERDALLSEISRTLEPGDLFLVSADLVKPKDVLEACYNDPPGRSAFVRFRLNHLTHLNRRFDGDFVVDRFQARAHYDEPTTTVEGHLYARVDHVAHLRALEVELALPAGDSVNVGYSVKFDPTRFVGDLRRFRLDPEAEWVDRRWKYGLFLFRRT